MSDAVSVHLVVLIHGLWGAPSHMRVAQDELERAWSGHSVKSKIEGTEEEPVVTSNVSGREGEDLVTIIAGGMTSQLTYDGIDVCASRVAYEVDVKVEELETQGKRVDKISVTGYSLGGLVARYLVGLLESREPSFFDRHRPISFSTIATPHLGIPRYNTLISSALGILGSRVMSRSGEQLWAADSYANEDRRPLLEIMADPRHVFYHALERFQRIQIYASAVNDNSVPYPTAAIDPVDHFVQWEQRKINVDVDEDGIIRSWQTGKGEDGVDNKIVKQTWSTYIGTLPPVLRYRYPYNYLILVLLPIMLPLILFLILFRQSLDTRRSKRRIQQLTSITHGAVSPASPIPTPSGLSIQRLQEAIRRVEHQIESDLVESFDVSNHQVHAHPAGATVKVQLKDSQMRMAMWLNQLTIQKYITYWPDVANTHATIVVRNPKQFPAHERGRGLLKRWARGVIQQ